MLRAEFFLANAKCRSVKRFLLLIPAVPPINICQCVFCRSFDGMIGPTISSRICKAWFAAVMACSWRCSSRYWVGDLPIGLSLSTEIGYQRPIYFADTWTIEIRPIIDKKVGKSYASVNPTFDKSFHGPSQNLGWDFSPNVKVSYDFTKKIAGGLEYYGAVGSLASIDPFREQQQQFFPSIDLDVSPKWEINFGVGVGVTASTDHLIFKPLWAGASERARRLREWNQSRR